ncbi:MAG: DNA methyltransferase [Phycisphaerae bacterium]|jgi:site-specific DNA-methyltransferase (adenine-specific)
MSHQSENCLPLRIKNLKVDNIVEIKELAPSIPAVYLFILPYNSSSNELEITKDFIKSLKGFISRGDNETVICFLASPQTASKLLLDLQKEINYKLWVSVKYDKPIIREGELPYNHSTLLILGNYKGNLKHNKTRIAYTYCPSCNKTTKDYGGKKHTYHSYGTLMSDVWRDISISPDKFPNSVVDRLKDVFGITPYKTLFVINLLELFEYKKSVPVRRTFDLIRTNEISENYHDVLLNGNCLEILKELPSNSIDYCFADPPYNLRKKYDSWEDSLSIKDYFEWCDRWLCELGRIIKPNCTVTILNIPLWTVRHYKYMKNILNFQKWITWEGLSLPVRMIMPANYSFLCFSKGKPRKLALDKKPELLSLKEFYCIRQSCINNRKNDREPITDLWWDIHRLKHNTRRADHPCQLPSAIMKRLISLFTNEGEIVLDPFNGVGTTTLSAKHLNRKYIGIELSDYYHKIAQERHKELLQGLDPFRKNGSTPKAKNSTVPRLKKQKYVVSKKVLQLEVKRIAQNIGRLPTRREVEQFSKYPIEYYNDYFISWGEVCAAARTTGMKETRDIKKEKEKVLQFELF